MSYHWARTDEGIVVTSSDGLYAAIQDPGRDDLVQRSIPMIAEGFWEQTNPVPQVSDRTDLEATQGLVAVLEWKQRKAEAVPVIEKELQAAWSLHTGRE